MIVKLLTELNFEFLSLTGGCRGSSESTHVKMSNCWKSHATAHIGMHLLASTILHRSPKPLGQSKPAKVHEESS